jgi:hypothetical protein
MPKTKTTGNLTRKDQFEKYWPPKNTMKRPSEKKRVELREKYFQLSTLVITL